MSPVTISGSNQGMMMSERPSVLPGNQEGKQRAREKPVA